MYSNPYYNNPQDALGAIAGLFACWGIGWLIAMVVLLWLFYRIFSRAGYSGWYTLLNLIPGIGTMIVIFMLAFGDWPVLRRQGPPTYPAGGGYGGTYPGGPGYGGPSSGSYAPPRPSGELGGYPPAPTPQPAPPVPEPPVPPVASYDPEEPTTPVEEPPLPPA